MPTSEAQRHAARSILDRASDTVPSSTQPPRIGRGLSRREALKLTTASALGLAVAGCKEAGGSGTPTQTGARGGAAARNVILLVSDGMSNGTLSLAEPFSRLVRGPERGTHWVKFSRRDGVAAGLVDTGSLDSLVTDSAAAASAWGGGSRVNNGAINTLPDGTTTTPLARLLKDTGRRVGLVTTTTLTHATPAGFAANQARRKDQHLIAPQFLDTVDVLMGGGREFFDPLSRDDGEDLIGRFIGAGYAFWDQRGRVLGPERAPRILGLFGRGHLPYTIDHRADLTIQQDVPTLAEMTRAALASLEAASGDQGFFLMVEGGRVDHAAHNNDAAAMLWDQLAFDDAVGEALHFLGERRDTLLIITTDHGNANPGLNGIGTAYHQTNTSFARLAGVRSSFDKLLPALRDAVEPPAAVIQQHTGLDLPEAHAHTVLDAIRSEIATDTNLQHANAHGLLGQSLGNFTGVQFTGVSHTQDLAILHAFGPGADDFRGLTRNIDTFSIIAQAFNLRYQPSATPQTTSAKTPS